MMVNMDKKANNFFKKLANCVQKNPNKTNSFSFFFFLKKKKKTPVTLSDNWVQTVVPTKPVSRFTGYSGFDFQFWPKTKNWNWVDTLIDNGG
jgi:hypothetical protein